MSDAHQARTSRRRDVSPEPRKLLDDLMSMSVADIDRERLVNAYLDALIRAVDANTGTNRMMPLQRRPNTGPAIS